MQIVIFVVMATPAGSMVSMLAQQYDREYLLASKGIAGNNDFISCYNAIFIILLNI